MQKITGAKPVRDAIFCPQSILSDALLWYGSQLGAIPGGGSNISQSSQRSSGFHKPAVSGAAPETATIFASMQQPADFFCKEFLPEHHRLEAPFHLLA
jgi:hypothetical protein